MGYIYLDYKWLSHCLETGSQAMPPSRFHGKMLKSLSWCHKKTLVSLLVACPVYFVMEWSPGGSVNFNQISKRASMEKTTVIVTCIVVCTCRCHDSVHAQITVAMSWDLFNN